MSSAPRDFAMSIPYRLRTRGANSESRDPWALQHFRFGIIDALLGACRCWCSDGMRFGGAEVRSEVGVRDPSWPERRRAIDVKVVARAGSLKASLGRWCGEWCSCRSSRCCHANEIMEPR